MGRASSSKKVARAAGIGGGRTNRGKAPVLWYGSLIVILLAGVGLTSFSRNQRLDQLGSPTSKEEPRAGSTHWHVAYGVRVCDKWLDPVKDQVDPKGVHTHGEGVIHVHPSVASAAGKRATFQRFTEAVNTKVSVSQFTWPTGQGNKTATHKNGDKCGDQPAEVKAFYNGVLHKGDPADIRFTDRGKLVLALVPKDTTYEQIGDPPSTAGLDKLSDVAPAQRPQATDPNAGAPPDPSAPADPSNPASPPASTPGDPATSTPPPSPVPNDPATPAPPPTSLPAEPPTSASPPSSTGG